MQFRLRVEAPGGPVETRFLHVLQGVDPGFTADSATLIISRAGTPFAGVVVAATAVLFPVEVGVEVTDVVYAVPEWTTRHLITGLVPGGSFEVETEEAGAELIVKVRTGTGRVADNGGVLVVDVSSET
jgi:hypothetical protein